MTLSHDDQITALRLARAALEHHVKNQPLPSLEKLGLVITPALEEKRGVFVTLYHRHAATKILRGCIGTLQPLEPLYEAIIANARNAASSDARFMPVSEVELGKIFLEINVLTPTQSIDSYKKIRLGEDGIILSHGLHRAVFLPAVPIEWGWDLPETLAQLAKKAGLSEQAWQEEEARFEIFQSESFSEKV